MPFGDGLFVGTIADHAAGIFKRGDPGGVSILFTGQYRDTELANSALPSGLDYFMARQRVVGSGAVFAAGPSGTLRSRPRQSAELASVQLRLE